MAWCILLSIFHYQNNLFIHKEFIQMSDRCFNTLQEQNNKNTYFNCLLAYNFVKMTVPPRIQTQGDNIPVEHTNHSPKSLSELINTTYIIIRQFA